MATSTEISSTSSVTSPVDRISFNPRFECMEESEMKSLQLQFLRETVSWVRERVPFYREALRAVGLSADTPVNEFIATVDDIHKLPFTVKDDLRANYPFGLCAVPMDQVARVHASSGTTGKPITGTYTATDIEMLGECVARSLFAAGARPGDCIHNAYGYGLFTGGLGFHEGVASLGAVEVPASCGLTERQVMLLRDFHARVLCCTPSYALTIAEKAADMHVNVHTDLHLKAGLFGAEPCTPGMRKQIEERLGIRASEIYGLTELGGPGVAYDCSAQSGLHINEDHFLAEVIDPQTLAPLPLGEPGELVFTSLQRKAMPMIRYRTRDITRLWRERCKCGRTTLKMDKVLARADDMLKINGANVFPSQIEALLLEIPEVQPQYTITVSKRGYLDWLTVAVEGTPEVFASTTPEQRAEIEIKIEKYIKGTIGVGMKIKLVEPRSLARSESKAKRVFDERPKL
ncbi:phenylacetate--CoA ligase [Pelomyxa schiedti]|nr:phenylacetate--CoA ligase [Pelomyxa schiedti]